MREQAFVHLFIDSEKCNTTLYSFSKAKRKNKPFLRFAVKEGISDNQLCEAVRRAERGVIDANLGGGVIKQRIARLNEGRSGGYRSIVLFREGDRFIFVYGFAKNERDNIQSDELKAFKDLAEIYLNLTNEQIQLAIESEKLFEVKCDDKSL